MDSLKYRSCILDLRTRTLLLTWLIKNVIFRNLTRRDEFDISTSRKAYFDLEKWWMSKVEGKGQGVRRETFLTQRVRGRRFT